MNGHDRDYKPAPSNKRDDDDYDECNNETGLFFLFSDYKASR